MNIYDRISRALRRRWARFGCGPKKFHLNIDHWEQLGKWFDEQILYRPPSMYSGKPTMFIGTKLVLQ